VPLTEDAVDVFLQRMYGFDPELKWKVSAIRPTAVPGITEVIYFLGSDQRATHLYVTPDGEHAVAGQIIPFGPDPFAAERATLVKSTTGISKGAPDAKVAIVVFSDLQCPHCKNAEPILEKLQQDVPASRLVYQQFPLVQIHPWATLAAKYSDCIARTNAEQAFKFNDGVFGQQEQITPENAADKLNAIASAHGIDATKVGKCAADPATMQRVQQSIDLGQSLGVDSTPTLFVNGRKLTGITDIPYETLKSLAEWEVKQTK
jgi:protein-disulfide isomerase